MSGGEHPGGLAAIRALRAAGYEPWAAATTDRGYGALSRASAGTVAVSDPRADPLSFAGELAKAASRLGAAVVLPGTEAALLALGEHRDLFAPDVAVGAPPPEVTIAATDKQLMSARAEAAGFTVPDTQLVTAETVTVADVTFPAVVKPVRSELAGPDGLQRFEVVRAADRAELAEALDVLPGRAALVQPYVTGPIRTVNGVCWNGEVVAAVHKLAERTWPADCGVVSYARTVPVEPDVDRAARTLLADIGWSGLFNLQMIESGGKHHVIDLNPRIYHSLALAVGAGANLPAIWVALLLGRPLPPTDYRPGVRFRSEEDALALASAFRHGDRRAAVRAALPRRDTVHAIASISDPQPMLGLVDRAVRRVRRTS